MRKGDGMEGVNWFNEGEMQAFDDLVAILTTVVVEKSGVQEQS